MGGSGACDAPPRKKRFCTRPWARNGPIKVGEESKKPSILEVGKK